MLVCRNRGGDPVHVITEADADRTIQAFKPSSLPESLERSGISSLQFQARLPPSSISCLSLVQLPDVALCILSTL